MPLQRQVGRSVATVPERCLALATACSVVQRGKPRSIAEVWNMELCFLTEGGFWPRFSIESAFRVGPLVLGRHSSGAALLAVQTLLAFGCATEGAASLRVFPIASHDGYS